MKNIYLAAIINTNIKKPLHCYHCWAALTWIICNLKQLAPRVFRSIFHLFANEQGAVGERAGPSQL